MTSESIGDMTERPSPNFDDRACPVDMVILHYTGMETAAAALDRLCDPAAKVSAHYLIEEDGTLWRLVPEEKRAWHAGVSRWQDETDVNSRSIGIELVNPGHEFGYRAFPEAQMARLEALLADVLARHRIAPARVLGHSDVAPARKQDPGELFDWPRLARAGLAIWPGPRDAPDTPDDVPPAEEARALLSAIGYDDDAPVADAVAAFQRRFVPDAVTGALDARTRAAIAAVRRIST